MNKVLNNSKVLSPTDCFTAIIISLHHRLVSETVLLILLTQMISMKLITELKSPTAALKLKLLSKSPLRYT